MWMWADSADNSRAPVVRVLVCGPDGTGKSSLTTALLEELPKAEHAHFRRRLKQRAATTSLPPHGTPGNEAARSAVGAAAKVIYFALSNVLVEALRPTGGSRQLIMERGWHDQLIHRERYRLPLRIERLVAVLGRLQPRYDLAILCVGDARMIHARKPELGHADIEQQVQRWRELVPELAKSIEIIDTVSNNEQTAALLATTAVRRVRSMSPWKQVLIRPRRMWIAFRGTEAAALVKDLYQPQSSLAKAVLRAQCSSNLLLRLAPRHVGALEDALRRMQMEGEPAAAIASSTDGRVVARVGFGDKAAYVKVGRPQDAGLKNEIELLRNLTGRRGFPVLRTAIESDSLLASVTRPVLGVRPGGPSDGLSAVLTLQAADLTHQDLAPWNIVAASSDVVVLDLEAACSPHVPFADLAHYLACLGGTVGALTPREAAEWAESEEPLIVHYANNCRVGTDDWREALAVQLRQVRSASSRARRWADETAEHLLMGD